MVYGGTRGTRPASGAACSGVPVRDCARQATAQIRIVRWRNFVIAATPLFQPSSGRIDAIVLGVSFFENLLSLVIDHVPKLKLNFGMANSLDEGIERSADCLKPLGICELSRESDAVPSGAEGTVASHDQVVANFRNRNSSRER